MIETDLLDRYEYKIGDDWSVREVLCIKCPLCGVETVEIITYPDMTLYYHAAKVGPNLSLCTVLKGAEQIVKRLEPWFEAVPMTF